jgi:hypothetical protein
MKLKRIRRANRLHHVEWDHAGNHAPSPAQNFTEIWTLRTPFWTLTTTTSRGA